MAQHAASMLVLKNDAVLCQIVSPRYLSRSSLLRLAGLPCRLLVSYGLHVLTREVHRSSLRRLLCPAQDHFICLIITDLIFILCDVCPLLYPGIGLSVLACDVECHLCNVVAVEINSIQNAIQ